MTAASVAALTVYDMVKGVERGVEIRASGSSRRAAARAASGSATAAPTRRGRRRRRPRPGDARRRPDRRSKRQRPGAERATARRTGGARPDRQRRGRAPGSATTHRARRSADRLAALGFAVERALVADDAARSRPRSSTAPPRTTSSSRPAGRPDAARRDAAGDGPSSTTRCRAWPRRCAPPAGRSRRSPTCRAASSASRPDAGRQRAGQPEGRHRIARRHRAGARPRPRDARGPVRPRRWEREADALFGPFAEVPLYPLVFPCSGARSPSSASRWPATCGCSRRCGPRDPAPSNTRSRSATAATAPSPWPAAAPWSASCRTRAATSCGSRSMRAVRPCCSC